MNNRLRASYTLLSTWYSGNYNRALEIYFKLGDFVTPSMVEGRNLHKVWESHISSYQKLPDVFGGKQLVNPQAEVKKVVQVYDWLEIVGVIDCYDSPTIYEFKSGKMSSENYASSRQAGVYGVLATLAGMKTEKAEIYHYDQYTKRSDMSIVHLTDKLLRDSLEFVETISSEIFNYFEENKLFERFSSEKRA